MQYLSKIKNWDLYQKTDISRVTKLDELIIKKYILFINIGFLVTQNVKITVEQMKHP